MSLQVPVPQPANAAVPLLKEEDGVVVSSPPPYAAVHIRVSLVNAYEILLLSSQCHLLSSSPGIR